MEFRPPSFGFFGKLPAKGDFVRDGLPEDFVAAWDLWCRESLNASRAALGDAWETAWMEAPIWRFLLPAGACGGQAVLGVWLPSMDKVGRHFPFVLCALAPSGIDLEYGGIWLDGAEAAALAAVVDDAPHETLRGRLETGFAEAALPGHGWWTDGSPHVQPRHLHIEALLPDSMAGAMLSDAVVTESL